MERKRRLVLIVLITRPAKHNRQIKKKRRREIYRQRKRVENENGEDERREGKGNYNWLLLWSCVSSYLTYQMHFKSTMMTRRNGEGGGEGELGAENE